MNTKPCSNYYGYSVTEDGKVLSHRKRFGKGKGKGGGVVVDFNYTKELNQFISHGGYPYVAVVRSDGKRRSTPVHVLMMDAYEGNRPEGQEVRHLDGNPLNNHRSNLTYGTPKENAADRLRCGKDMVGVNHPRARFTELQIKQIRSDYNSGSVGISAMARKYSVAFSTINDIVKRKNWKHID